jgi:hypothetical protein
MYLSKYHWVFSFSVGVPNATTRHTRGFRTQILVFPNDHSMVIILTNRDQGEPMSEAKKIADLLLILH